MPEIPFTQYIRPDGRRQQTYIKMPLEVGLLARVFLDAGGSYTSELLSPEVVSFCAVFRVDGEEIDIACVVCPNDSEVVKSVEMLVRDSFEFLQRMEIREEKR